jgi:hypothetical protein
VPHSCILFDVYIAYNFINALVLKTDTIGICVSPQRTQIFQFNIRNYEKTQREIHLLAFFEELHRPALVIDRTVTSRST